MSTQGTGLVRYKGSRSGPAFVLNGFADFRLPTSATAGKNRAAGKRPVDGLVTVAPGANLSTASGYMEMTEQRAECE